MIDGWTPGIGDPTPLGWFTVLAYLVAAALCLRAGFRDWRSARLWLALATALLLLAINKQLDLQSMLTAIGRQWALDDHWYAQRREWQHAFVLLVGVAALVMALLALLIVYRRSRALKGASIGFVLLCGFIVIRAASFHDMDRFLHTRILNLRWNHVIELGGIAVIAASAASARIAKRPARRARRR